MKLYLCIDLEATCSESGLLDDMEAIELGVVALNEARETIDEFQSFIKPKFTELTPYSTSIHNVTHAQLKTAPYLPSVMIGLQQWMSQLPGEPTSWYSWGSYDFRQLELDTSPDRWNIPLALPDHSNAKKLFQKKQFKKGRQVGLNTALSLMGLAFEGQKHRALDDARNIARLFGYFHTT